MKEKPEALSIKQVSEKLSVSDKTIRRIIKRGDLPHFKVMGAIRIPLAEVDKFINSNRAINKSNKSNNTDKPPI